MRIDVDGMDHAEWEAYRDECDGRSAAEFRMRRELCGIELSEMAEALDVRLGTAKKWERPDNAFGPSVRAWAYVDSAYLDLLDAVGSAVERIGAMDPGPDGSPSAVVGYRRTGMQTRHGETVGMANAVSRAVALSLTVLGYGVSAEWADEGLCGLASEIVDG